MPITLDPQREEHKPGQGLPDEDTPEWLKQKEKKVSPDQAQELEDQLSLPAHDPEAIKSQEEAGDDDQDFSVSDGGGSSRGPSFRERFRKNRRKIGIIGSLTAASAGLLIAGFLALLPLKVLHVVQNLENHFYSTVHDATQRETDKLFSDYLKKYVLPARRLCAGKVSKDCNAVPLTQNPVTRLFHGWQDARLEEKLATKFGLEFKWEPGRGYYMKAPALSAKGVDLREFADSPDMTLDEFIQKNGNPEFTKVTRQEIRAYVKDSVAGETRWKRVLYRYKIGRLLEEKYGIKRCIIFCKAKDSLSDSIDAQKRAAKLYLVERVVQPLDASLAVVLKCYFDPACEPSKTETKPCTTGVDCALHNSPENPNTDTELRKALADLSTRTGVATGKILEELSASIEKDGLQKFVIKYVLGKVFQTTITTATADKVSAAIPVVGWVNMAFQIVEFGDKAGPKLKKLNYLRNAAAAVSMYAMYRTYADEVKHGNANAFEVGSFTNSLGPVAKNASSADLKGGTAGAEQSPLYSKLLGDKSGIGAPTYKCDNGLSPAGVTGLNLTCPEEKLAAGNDFFNGLHSIISNSGLGFIASVWRNSIGVLFNLFSSAVSVIFNPLVSFAEKVCSITGFLGFGQYLIPPPWGEYCAIRDAAKAAGTKIMELATTQLFPTPFSNNMGGGRTFDMMAAGSDVSGNDFAHVGLGGQVLSNQQVADIQNTQAQERYQQYSSQSFFARMLDKNSEYSAINKLAAAIPSSPSTALTSSIASFTSHPLSKITSIFGNLFNLTSRSASAATGAATGAAAGDAFGVTQYGYPEGPIIIPVGPMKDKDFWHVNHGDFWDTYCEPKNPDGSQNQNYINYYDQWNKDAAAALDPNTGMPLNTNTNGCLLIESTTGSAGAVYDPSLLTPDDLGSNSSTPVTGGNPGGVPFNPGPTTPCLPGISGYCNPLRDLKTPGFAGFDEGADYTGDGPVHALGNGVVSFYSTSTGWPGPGGTRGSAISYVLSDGPAKGLTVYVAENCTLNPSLNVGSQVTSDTVLCTMHNTWPFIETGWAKPNSDSTLAHECYTKGTQTTYGANFGALMQSLGAPAGGSPGGTCSLPANFPTW